MQNLMHGSNIICKVSNIRAEISQQCLNPAQMAGNLALALSKRLKSTSGHIHSHFQNKSDHIVLVWSNGLLKRIVAKSPHCKKGQYVKWKHSLFCDYKQEEVLEKLCDEIERVEIDGNGFNKTWSSYGDLVWWLVEQAFSPRSRYGPQ